MRGCVGEGCHDAVTRAQLGESGVRGAGGGVTLHIVPLRESTLSSTDTRSHGRRQGRKRSLISDNMTS